MREIAATGTTFMLGSLSGELPACPRILVVSLRRIGDVLLTTPLLRSLRRAWPSARIDVLVFDATAGILAGNPDIQTIVKIPARPTALQNGRLLARLWKRYDLTLSTQVGDRPTFYTFVAGRRRAGLVANGGTIGDRIKRAMLHCPVEANDRIHRVEQTLQLCDALGIARVPKMVPPAAARNMPPFDGDYAVIHAAPLFRYKEWTRDGWRALAVCLQQRGLRIVAIGGPDEAERLYLEKVWQGIADVRQVRWPQTVALLNKARLYVGPDTSVTHLAAATGCPTVALFGPMDPRVWGPWPVGGLAEPWQASGTVQNRGNVWIVQNPLPCLPCTFEGCERHVGSRSACLDELKPELVLQAADAALATGPARRNGPLVA